MNAATGLVTQAGLATQCAAGLGARQSAPCAHPFKSAHPNRIALGSKASTFTPTLQTRSITPTRATPTPRASLVVAAAAGSQGSIAVAGATGLIGTKLVQDLLAQGYTVKVLTRNPSKARGKLNYQGVEFIAPSQWASAICGTKAVVNLAGEPIATRWTDDLKREIKRSRVEVTNKVVAAINACPENQRPSVLVNASAVGYYGASDSQTFNEASSSGNDYLAEVCRDWEAAAVKANTRVVVLRNGIVLAKVNWGPQYSLLSLEIFYLLKPQIINIYIICIFYKSSTTI